MNLRDVMTRLRQGLAVGHKGEGKFGPVLHVSAGTRQPEKPLANRPMRTSPVRKDRDTGGSFKPISPHKEFLYRALRVITSDDLLTVRIGRSSER